MNLYYRFFLSSTYVRSLAVLLVLSIFLGSVSYGSERDRDRSIAIRASGMIKLLKEDPANTIQMDFLRDKIIEAKPFAAKASTTIEITYLTQNYLADQGVWENDSREFYVIDNAGRIVEDVYQRYVDGDWVNVERYIYEYSGDSQIPLHEVFQIWDDESGAWENISKYILEIDAQGRVISEIWQDWDPDAEGWVNIEREILEYNQEGRLAVIIIEEWDGGAWEPYEKIEILYSPEGSFSEIIEYSWFDGVWEEDYRMRWVRENGLLTQFLSEYWDGEEWVVEAQQIYEYDDDGNNTVQLFRSYNDFDEVWENEMRFLYSYDAAGNRTESITQFWDEDEEDWMGFMRSVFEYDNRGNRIRSTRYIWFASGSESQIAGQWNPSSRSSYLYDGNDNELMMVAEFWDGQDWVPSYRILYSGYEPTNVVDGGGLPREFALLQNYPNPFNPSTTIRYSIPERTHVILHVYNTLGQEVARLIDKELEAGNHQITFDASHLPSGVYVYRLQAGDRVDNKKLMLLK